MLMCNKHTPLFQPFAPCSACARNGLAYFVANFVDREVFPQ